ncbi:MAG TPA: hypothetical protein VN680_20400 [Burkholderiaceae bacterium]|nr:hypothetical protein [Burkholderiaceae bacterium]
MHASTHVEPVRELAPLSHAPIDLEPEAVMPVIAAPRVQRYELPMRELTEIAGSAGLEWVNSDADKVRLAQEAIANAPKPIHVPREPKPMAAIDDGPLVLVETRRDLGQFKLPFEQQQR